LGPTIERHINRIEDGTRRGGRRHPAPATHDGIGVERSPSLLSKRSDMLNVVCIVRNLEFVLSRMTPFNMLHRLH
jgi:hypothetical protein